MLQLMYVSTSAAEIGEPALREILEASRRNNAASGITGMLLHIDGGFLQILEGPQAAVQRTYARIGGDRRHCGLRVLYRAQSGTRLFPDWTMGFDKPPENRPDGLFEATRAAVEGAIDEEKAAELAILMRTFYRVHAGRHAD